MHESQKVSHLPEETQLDLRTRQRQRLAKRMAAYSVTAAATVTATHTADAAINWSGLGPSNIVNGAVDIDIDGDGDLDFRLSHNSTASSLRARMQLSFLATLDHARIQTNRYTSVGGMLR